MSRASTAWRIWLVVAASALAAVLVAVTAALAAATSTAPTAALQSCWQLFIPVLTLRSAAVIVLGAIGSAVVIAAAWSLVRQLHASRRYSRRLEIAEQLLLDGEPVRVVGDSRPLAFTLGLFRPRVCISTGARARLTAEQLSAVVAHEAIIEDDAIR